jgi:ketosteroid isomerase-like protein
MSSFLRDEFFKFTSRRLAACSLLTLAILFPAAASAADKAVNVMQEFTKTFNSKDADKVVLLYAPDALVISETGVAQGREAIKARLSASMKKGTTIDSLTPERNETSGNLSFTEGVADVNSGGQHLHRHYLVIVKTVGSHSEIIVHYSLPNPAKVQ